jgi:uncharacterized protein (DUF2267 family)
VDSATFIRRLSDETGLDREHTERALRALLLNVGIRIDPGEADDLAAQLPSEFGGCVRHEGRAERFPPSELVRRITCVVPLSNEQSKQSVRAFFTVLREAITEGELEDVLGQLGTDYEALVGLPTGKHAASLER